MSHPLRNGLGTFLEGCGATIVDAADDLAYFVASSAPLHCLDACRNLGRALSAVNRGDWRTATHLGYYSEIRSAMSLLATQGIAIGDDEHVIFPVTGAPRVIRGLGTHKLVWEALDFWSKSDSAVQLLHSSIRPGSIGLRDWFAAADASVAPGRLISSEWFSAWGIDLNRMSSDREARNEVSYNPSGVVAHPTVGTLDGCSFLTDLWSAFEPSSDAQFPELDIQLLRAGLSIWWEQTEGCNVATGNPDVRASFQGFLDRVLDRLQPVGRSRDEWKSILQYPSGARTPDLLTRASNPTSKGSVGCFNVLARASLLLRVSIGASAGLLKHAGSNKDEFEVWLAGIAVECGFVDNQSVIESLSDLWSDVREGVDYIGQIAAVPAATTETRRSWLDRTAKFELSLTGAERIGLWGLEP